MENRFNLIDEPWIPVVDVGRVSLRDIFTRSELRGLGGNPIQKIALMKLLLAIAQAANTPKDDAQWQEMGWQGMAQDCLAYLDKWHDRFFLYGERPFLQMPSIVKAAVQSFGSVSPEVATGNTTVLTQSQMEKSLTDADKALVLVGLMGFALGGKKTDNSVMLSQGYRGKFNDKGKPSTGKPGPSVAHMGLLHNFWLGTDVLQTLWINLLTEHSVMDCGYYQNGVGVAPWENMPVGEFCSVAQKLRGSLMGRLVPLCRFCLLSESGLHYSEGIYHPDYHDGVVDPTVSVNFSGKKAKVLWVNPEKRPWRELTSLLGFLQQGTSNGFDCLQLRAGLDRLVSAGCRFALWSGGLRVSSNAGEQYASGSDDYVESVAWLDASAMGDVWFARLKNEMDALDGVSRPLYGCVLAYYKQQTMEGEKLAAQATHLFWQLCERDFQALIDACNEDSATLHKLRRCFAGYVQQSYDFYCPNDTARQMDAWAKCRPNLSSYLKQEDK